MPPSYFPLRWESTGDQWWYASPIDWAAANGHYDLVRELIRLDGNHLINLTSLRRIRRLETVWDDEEQFDDVAKCRSQVARRLFMECEIKKGKNSLFRAGYGGWLLYTAASAGDSGFVQELLERDPLIVFGEGEYGVTDILYAAARSKNSEVFRVVYDFAASPRSLAGGNGRELEEHVGEIPSGYKLEMMNRAIHAAARGGNLDILKDLLGDGSAVLAFRDIQGSTILHSAACRGQVEVVKDLVASSNIIDTTDNRGNTALHVAAYRGQLAVVETMVLVSPSSIHLRNNAGETFLHMAVSGFHTPNFRRLDKQIELMKQLVSGKVFSLDEIVNVKNNDGRTALHVAIVGNIHCDLVEQLTRVRSIDVNIRDLIGMTALDILKQRPRSASSDLLTRRLISAGGIFGYHDYAATKAIASHLKMRSIGNSPGTSFKISDTEMFLFTGIETDASFSGLSSYYVEPCQRDSTVESCNPSEDKKPGSVSHATQHLKRLLHWPNMKERRKGRLKKLVDNNKSIIFNAADENLIPLRQRFSKPSSLPNNKRTLAVRSNLPSPNAKKKFASGIRHDIMKAIPHLTLPRRSRSSSFSKSPLSSPCSLDNKHKGVFTENNDVAGPSCSNEMSGGGTPDLIHKQGSINKRLMNQYFCFGVPGQMSKEEAAAHMPEPDEAYKSYVLSVA